MANSGFLFCGDAQDFDTWDWYQGGEGPFYRSRWNIPFAWWFFFDLSDVKFFDVNYSDTHWQEARFVADKQKAFDTFRRRKPLLLRLAVSKYSAGAIVDDFLQTLGAWPGKYLLCDPSGIFAGGGDEQDFVVMNRIAEALDTPDVSDDYVLSALRYSYLSDKDEWDFAEKLVGFPT